MPRADQVGFVAHAWDYALGVSIRGLPDGPEREALIACEERPTVTSIRAVLAIGRDHPWLQLIEAALVEIGLLAIQDILKEADHDDRN